MLSPVSSAYLQVVVSDEDGQRHDGMQQSRRLDHVFHVEEVLVYVYYLYWVVVVIFSAAC